MLIGKNRYKIKIEELLRRVQGELRLNGSPLLRVIKPSGENVMITCPYHKDGMESRPSAGVSGESGVFHCFACGEIKSLPQLVGDLLNCNGVQWIQDNYSASSLTQRELNLFEEQEEKTYVPEEELKKYSYLHPYMFERKLTKPIIKWFHIGYDEHFKPSENSQGIPCLTFPVRDVKGNILFIARRSVKGKFFHYPRDVEKPVYGLYEIRKLNKKVNEIIICESMLDALLCWVYGKPAVALNGLGTPEQFKELRDFNCRTYILATDNDKDGKRAREKLIKNLNNKIVKEFDYNSWPKGCKDIGDMSKEQFNNLEIIFPKTVDKRG